jgi:hypothetical protein
MDSNETLIDSLERLVRSGSSVRILYTIGDEADRTEPMPATLALPMVKSLLNLGSDVTFSVEA